MTDKSYTGDPASLAGQRAHTMPGQRAVNLLVRGLLRTPGLAPSWAAAWSPCMSSGASQGATTASRWRIWPRKRPPDRHVVPVGTEPSHRRTRRHQAQRQAPARRRPGLHDRARGRTGVRAHGTRQSHVREVQQHPPQWGRRARSPRPPPRMGWRCTSNQAHTTMTGLASVCCSHRTGPSACATPAFVREPQLTPIRQGDCG